MPRPVQSTSTLLSVRSALILGLSLIFGAAAAVLTYFAVGSAAGAILAAGAATAGAIGLLNQIVSGATDNNGD
ncbi:hypothetical protein IMZ11_40330 [Microtetraspora sp. AC03309]|uniref:hypothetical protein n=1 Tax=Microtetraspora sp. AC03309 TaxID=2779376 RepID=UPI001E3C37E4|nr:hypothetical protein [Microtetraspora sp. AC03309]MCC5581867.1 hypothetical protein [Microtetraspora sp. AC03309]